VLVIAEGRDEHGLAGEASQLHGRDGSSSGGLLKRLARVGHLAGTR
jgi:hypothetical protein